MLFVRVIKMITVQQDRLFCEEVKKFVYKAVVKDAQSTDWFASIGITIRWNMKMNWLVQV